MNMLIIQCFWKEEMKERTGPHTESKKVKLDKKGSLHTQATFWDSLKNCSPL